MTKASVEFGIVVNDATLFETDVLVLKYARKIYGIDGAVLQKLGRDANVSPPEIGKHAFFPSRPAIGAAFVLWMGVEPLYEFGYRQIREFARRAMSALRESKVEIETVAFTLHGAGYGLDENEAFESELAGIFDALSRDEYPVSLKKIQFVERDQSRAERLSTTLDRLLPSGKFTKNDAPLSGPPKAAKSAFSNAGLESSAKPRVFVAMPFADSMSDVFHYGIQGAVNAAGMLAERADLSAFTGDVLDWVKTRIEGATLVVADMTDANPNVYLEVGYAWGKGVRTVLLSKSSADLKFDVRGQRCLVYSSIKDLEAKLTQELAGLADASR